MVGEHIRVKRAGRWQHAIDCGDETVLHLADEPGEAPVRVRRSYRPEFVSGAELVEVVTHRERTFPPSEVVARAFSRIADPVLASMFRDSEAFADWCATGRISSASGASPAEAPAPSSARPAEGGGKRAVVKAPAKKRASRGAAPRARRARKSASGATRGSKRGRNAKGKGAKTGKKAARAASRKPGASKGTRRPARRTR